MAATTGRNLVIYRGSEILAACTMSKSITMNGEPVDITADCDDGYRRLLDEAGVRSVDLSVEGVTENEDLLETMLSGGSLLIEDVRIVWEETGSELSGAFFFTNYEETGAHNDAIKFTGSFQSSGAWVFTPGASG